MPSGRPFLPAGTRGGRLAQDVQRILRLDQVDEPGCRGHLQGLRQEIARQEATRRTRCWLASFRNDRKAILDNLEPRRVEQVGALRDLTEYGANWGRTFQRSALTP